MAYQVEVYVVLGLVSNKDTFFRSNVIVLPQIRRGLGGGIDVSLS